MADGFLGRWSKRKLDAKEGKPLPPEPDVAGPQAPVVPASPVIAANAGIQASPAPTVPEPASAPAPLTLEDAQALTPESDFRPFAARGVAPEVQNAAMKKLFSDPHFNVMDRLDTYIDDYSQPDPIPKDMLRKLASAKFLGLFDAEEKEEAERASRSAREVADNPTGQTVAQSAAAPAVPSALAHDDPDLRLQQDHATPGKAPGDGAA
jgi:hypothetical protein